MCPRPGIIPSSCAEYSKFLFCSSSLRGQRPSPLHEHQAVGGVAQVKAQEEALRQAQLKYDLGTAKSILADEFVGTWDHGEQVDKDHFLALIGDKDDPLELLDYGEMKIRVYGETAVVWSTIHERAVYGGRIDESRGRRTAVWVKRDGNWQCLTIHTSPFAEKAHQQE